MGLAWSKDVTLPTLEAAIRRDVLLDELAHFTQQIQRVDKHLNSTGQAHASVQLLQALPGVGPRTAEVCS